MTLNEFVNKYLGKKVDFDGAYGGQCVDLYRQYVKDVIGGLQSAPVVGAADIWETYNKDTFERIANTPAGVPTEGDVMLWNKKAGGGFGHVAIYLSGDANKFVSLDQNWPTLSLVTKTSHNYTNVIGWLHPKETMPTQKELDTCLADRKKFWEERDALLALIPATDLDNAKAVLGGIRGQVTDLTNRLGASLAEQKNKEEIISRLQSGLLQRDDDIKSLEDKLDLSNNTVAQLGKDKGTLAIECEQLKIRVDTLTKQVQDGSITVTLLDLFKMLLAQKVTIRR